MGRDITFSVDMSDLKKHIHFVKNGLGSSRTDLPVMLLYWEVEGTKATIFASDKEMFCRTEMRVSRYAEGDEVNGSFAVLGSKLQGLIASVESEMVHFRVEPENLEIQAGMLTVNFELFDGSSVKTVEIGVSEHLTMSGLTVQKSAMEEALVCSKSCTTANSIRPDVGHAELRNGRMLSSDGRKAMVYSHDGFPKEVQFKAPASTLSGLISAVKGVDQEALQVIEGRAYFYLKTGGPTGNQYTMGVRKVERSFPDLESSLGNMVKATDEIAVDKHILVAMLEGVGLSLPTDEVRVVVTISGEGKSAILEVSANNQLGRKSYERAACGRKAKEVITFPVSSKHLLDTLGVFKGDSVVDLTVLGLQSMMLINDKTQQRSVLTIIPFRTDKAVNEEQKDAATLKESRQKVKEKDTKPEEAGERNLGSDLVSAAVDDI